MSELPPCPLCGNQPIKQEVYGELLDGTSCCFSTETDEHWTRLAKLIRDGLAVEWIQATDLGAVVDFGGNGDARSESPVVLSTDDDHEAPTLHEAVQKARGE